MTTENKAIEIFTGMVWLLMGHLSLVAIASLLTWLQWYPLHVIAWYAFFGIGLTQLIYAIPLYRRYKRQRRFSAMKGVIIGAIITVLLNGSCFGLGLWLLYDMH